MINAGRVQKRKIVEDFENELKIKGIENREKYGEVFRKILDSVYKHNLQDIRPCITRYGTLGLTIIKDHKYIFLEVNEKRNYETMLSVTMFEKMENNGVEFLSLEKALKKIDNICRLKV